MARQSETVATTARRPRRRRRRQLDQAEFLSAFPQHPVLAQAVSAFVAGNYHDVQVICPRILSSDADEDVKDAARELLRRLQPDRLLINILWGTLLLLVILSLWAWSHG